MPIAPWAIKVHSIQIGRIAPLGPDEVPSGFVKRPVAGTVAVGFLGLDGDEQADLKVHGGREKAVYAYALENYAHWLAAFPTYGPLLLPGGLGENLTLAGCNESDVCIGDVVRIGSVLLQVSEPRQPCFKFALRFNDLTMPREMLHNGLTGWYYRVLEQGELTAGDAIRLQERPHREWPIARVHERIIRRRGTPEERAEYAHIATVN